MTRTIRVSIAAAASLAALLSTNRAHAHCFVGSRFFPATLAVEDPCVADEMSLPTISVLKNGADPSARQLDISGEFSKRITEDVGVSVGSAFTRLRVPGGPSASGWQNLETTLKYQFLTNSDAEFVMSAGLSAEWGKSGNASVGAEPFHVLTPTVWFGKGFGDLAPAALPWVGAFALTGQFGYAVPLWSRTVRIVGFDPDAGFDADIEHNPRVLVWGGALQYNFRYLQSNIVDIGLPDALARLIPIVEAQFLTPLGNRATSGFTTTGTVNPGVIWVGNYFQIAAEAIIPVNRASGRDIGWMAQIHFYLDDIFPRSIGRPLISGVLPTTIGRPSVVSYQGGR